MTSKYTINDQTRDDCKGQNLEIERGAYGISIKADGYGNAQMEPGYGDIIFIEKYEGELRLIVWADINQEDPTHTISLEGAREENRKD